MVSSRRYFSAAVLILNLTSFSLQDELLSARCQSSCLHQFEVRAKGNAERRKQLKHEIVSLCKADQKCSSCAEPCRKMFVSVSDCQETACKEVEDKETCKNSCKFLQKIYIDKPGVCPLPVSFPTEECIGVCQADGDCPEAQKCCSVGCGRKCVKVKKQDIRLLPIPARISVAERKRKRSAVIRWVMQKMSRNHVSTNANLYIIQWRWSVHRDEEKMTEWQTVMVKNKMYAIMKHLLSPGRYYQFRIAAVNQYGSRGYSNSSAMFKLSKEPRAPGQPTNIVLGEVFQDSSGLWSQKVSWKPPDSDLPIKNYVLEWHKTTADQADAYEEWLKRKTGPAQQGKRSAVVSTDENDDVDAFIGPHQKRTTVLPSYSTSANVQPLEPSSVFLVEVYAEVDSSDGKLNGERGIVFVRTPSANVSANETSTSPLPSISGSVTENVDSQLLQIRSPYYERGTLKTIADWTRHPDCTIQRNSYIVRWRLVACQPFANQEKTYYDLDSSGQDWAQLETANCFAELDELNFSCYYEMEVKQESENKVIVRRGFKTRSCDETSFDVKIFCDGERLRCFASQYHAECSWSSSSGITDAEAQDQTIVGYRTIITNTGTNRSNVTVSPANTYSILYRNLAPNTVYNLIVQTITEFRIKETLRTSFKTEGHADLNEIAGPSNESRNDVDELRNKDSASEETEDLELDTLSVDKVLELPLESGTAAAVRWSIKPFYLMFLFWLLRLRLT